MSVAVERYMLVLLFAFERARHVHAGGVGELRARGVALAFPNIPDV